MAGGHLFEQGGDAQPIGTQRVAWGGVGTITSNSTWNTIVTWLEGKLGFLDIAKNLSDVPNKETALTNLDAYSKTEVNNAISGKADKNNVLEKNNTVSFNPTSDYNPATKRYVDGLDGILPVGDISPGGTSVTISFGEELNTSAYVPNVVLIGDGIIDGGITFVVHTVTKTSFKVILNEVYGNLQNISVGWSIPGKYRS